ncbi:plastocyanin/azurin family copper-binding protein [Cohnella sp. GbtcB17]|uniref:plastocyanin/azurin family copper-binding protein n=1 Tax=Cohnella sp. GbtcB17 TaxID=2824762 RepID=UPI001C301B15|nr:plastocyanin/azurin family copper-binding protein [Cohnella sp. GbtcB17]
MNGFVKTIATLAMCASLLMPALASAADASAPTVQPGGASIKTDGQTAAELGLLIGEGSGVTADYLAKGTTRIQAAIISLRLQGKLEAAKAYTDTDSFADANLAGASNRPILAFLHGHPEYGWTGEGANRFNPLAPVSSQQLYKVLLEALGYRSNADFAYKDTEAFASGKGLTSIAGTPALTNAHMADALVESLSAPTAMGHSLFDMLQMEGVLPATAEMPAGERLSLRRDAAGDAYLADGKGLTLYFFSNDAENLDACQGQCVANWPLLTAEELQIPAGLNPADFTVVTHASGVKQWMYKGWPLYRFVKDVKAGDTLGEGVGGVWFEAKPDYRVMIGKNAELGSYLTDREGRTLYYFDKDTPQTSACTDTCLANWPAYDAAAGKVPSTLNATDFGTIIRPDGTKQAAFKGYALYYFVKDTKHGDVTGQNVNQVWFVVDPAKFSGTTAGQAAPAAPAEQTGKTYHIDIKDYSFGSGPLTVEAGSTIIFTNFDDMKHNAVAVDGSFAGPLLAKGESYSIKLDKPGTYDYYCQPHKAFMTGQIIVK